MNDLNGKYAIVTGATSGIGRATATELAKCGANVIIASRNEALGQEAVDEIQASNPKGKVSFQKLDLGSQTHVREFAERYKASGHPLHILIANAGANFPSKRLTDDGVPLPCQVNYLGHYTLARLLEPVLIKSAPARIVSVSSATHRYSAIRRVQEFLSQTKFAQYGDTKFAQVLFTFEAERRLGPLGVHASALDPGGVRTGVWKGRYAKPPFSWYINTFCSPPEDGAMAVMHAATVDVKKEDAAVAKSGTKRDQAKLRFYAKGAFAAPFLTKLPAPTYTSPNSDFVKKLLVTAAIAVASFVDYPLRHFSNNRILSKVHRIPAAGSAYNPIIAQELWDESAKLAKLSPNPQKE